LHHDGTVATKNIAVLDFDVFLQIAFYVGVQIDENSKDAHGLSPEMRQLSAVAAVKVAVRSLSAGPGPSSRLSSS